MFWFFQLQGMLQVVLATPFVVVAVSGMTDPQRHLHPAHWAGAALWFLGLLGESIADAQLAAFRRDPARRHGVCQDGLWRYSRHPNYFSEWLIWLGYAVFALGTDSVWSWTAWPLQSLPPSLPLNLQAEWDQAGKRVDESERF